MWLVRNACPEVLTACHVGASSGGRWYPANMQLRLLRAACGCAEVHADSRLRCHTQLHVLMRVTA